MTFPYSHGGGFIADSYDADAVTYFNAMSVAPDATRKGLLNDLILGLKADSIWTKITWLSVLAAHDAQAARVNIKTPSQVATVSGSPTFTTDRGYAGDGASAYLNSGVAGTTITDTDASLFAYVDLKGTALVGICGYRTARFDIQHGASSTARGYIVGAAVSNGSTSADDQFVCASRTGTTQTFQTNTTVTDTDTQTTDTLSNTNTIRFLANSTTYTDGRLSACGWGLHLGNTDATALRTRLATYLTAVGAL